MSITKRLPSGGVHTKFESTSSSDGSSSSESSSDEVSKEASSTAKKTAPTASAKNVTTQWDVRPSSSTAFVAGRGRGAGTKAGNTANKAANSVGRGRGRRGRGRRGANKRLHPGVIVGGDKDVLTTKSTLYMNEGLLEEKEHSSTMGNETTEVVKPPEVKPPPDYASFPSLEGAPRVGDKIAFKTLELSLDYTPQVSDYKASSTNVCCITSCFITLMSRKELYSTMTQMQVS